MNARRSGRAAVGLATLARGVARDHRGQITIVFALTLLVVLTAIGSAFDLGRAYMTRQGLASAAALTCQYGSASDLTKILGQSFESDTTTYRTRVNNYLTAALASQSLMAAQTNATPITYAATGITKVDLNASVPTTLMHLVGVTTVPVSASEDCVPVALPPAGNGTKNPVSEGFENVGCIGICTNYILPTGTYNTGAGNPNPNSSPPANPGYTGIGANGDTSVQNRWFITGYCLEIDPVTVVVSSVPEGTHEAELDCENGSHTGGNSSISTKVYLKAMNYELRYFYQSRIGNYNYASNDLCGTVASDTAWANDFAYVLDGNTGQPFGPRTNQLNAYFDQSSADAPPPQHTTLDGTQQLAGVNLIDACLYSNGFIERVMPITVTTEGYYWLSFAADGSNDSFGGQIDYIRMCPNTCTGSYQHDYPAAYAPAGGPNMVLFEDTFENPTYVLTNKRSNTISLNASVPTINNAGSGGWPGVASCSPGWVTSCPTSQTGWTIAPNNNEKIVGSAAQGLQALELTQDRGYVSRPFLLLPGYYKLNYNYISDITFPDLGGTVYCGSTPAAASYNSLTGSASFSNRLDSSFGSQPHNSSAVAVFMANAQLVSTPNAGTALGAAARFTNPDGSTSATPTVAPNAISLASYNASQVNPLLDFCTYAASWQSRTAYIKIVKVGYYWLVFAAAGTTYGHGGAIDDVKLTAQGNLFMSSPPAGAVQIPVPDPQPGAVLDFTGFSVIADQNY